MALILASGSPRRRELMSLITPDYTVITSDVDETKIAADSPAHLAKALATAKARAVADMLHLPAVADDSGLEVDALGKAPGVYSARYGQDWPLLEGESKDERNNRKLLAALEGVPDEQRTARFRCCMAMVHPSSGKGAPADLVASGAWEGRIAGAPSGTNGFGYDPLFFDPELGCTAAELDREAKMARSHRGKALQLIKPVIGAYLNAKDQ